jgi:hypothetical protein
MIGDDRFAKMAKESVATIGSMFCVRHNRLRKE